MATNGNSSATQTQLEKLEATITGGRVPSPVVDTTSDDVVARVDAAAELCREVGRYASDHGRYLDEISAAFAERLQAMTKEYAANMLAAEERKMAELRRILGKIAG
jgi:hypothetical protein